MNSHLMILAEKSEGGNYLPISPLSVLSKFLKKKLTINSAIILFERFDLHFMFQEDFKVR